MAGEWSTVSVIELQRGGILLVEDGNHGEYRPRADEFVDRGVAFIRAADMDAGRVLFESAAKINQRARERITKGIGAPGDVLLSHKGTVGKVALVPEEAPPFVCSPQTTFWRSRDENRLHRKYLYAFLRSPGFHAQLATRAGETDMAPYVSLTSQRGLSVVLPPIDEQRAIAHILSTLDDKIELNRRMNETLEAMAQALFKSWFVDFDPVRARAEGRDPGLPKPLANVFPGRLVDSELGESPTGWSAVPLYDIATYINGAAYAAFDPNDEQRGLPIIKIVELKAGVTPQTKFSEVQMPGKYRITRGDILFSWSGNPDTSIDTFVWLHDSAWLNQHIFRVVPHRPLERAFVLTLLKQLRPVFAKIARNKQTTGLGHVTTADMKRLFVVRPDDEVMRAWNAIAAPILERAFVNAVEIRSVTTLRNALLPKLISGELRVKDAERIMGTI